ncbi:GTP cyclohydrolase I [Cyphellophora europaea CBS 101466]|uniref:GTP cyclohydrolase 1 n=1 Tax=Cyphellophora europaea (strain CBS 101466) TaxID=1220924 RepID=W2RJJ4_CYPE1|nr:GTP cyclohydrolase I [Cyphellophora europaea CBS 101466]ETN36515.1 GTP cyclohydrolase I [Cyphellophora europaea CBS 101466]
MPAEHPTESSRPKPRSAVPSHMLNGGSPLHNPPAKTRAQERESLATSIHSTYRRRSVFEFDRPDFLPAMPSSASAPYNHEDPLDGYVDQAIPNSTSPPKDLKNAVSLKEPPRDVRDEAPPTPPSTATRPASPYTLNPPIDFDGLSWPSIGTRARLEQTPEEAQARLNKLSGAVRTIFECLGEDPDREGLRESPLRYAQALMYFTKGYEENVRDLVNGAVFHEDHDELVIVKDIDVFSLCEHHMVPFVGKMHIGYIPNRRVLGLSKLARLAEMFSRRLQVQERLTKQVALAIAEVLKPQGVAVVMESSHLCMVMRGVQKVGSSTTTSCMLGAMRSSAKTREEFLSLLNRGK